MQCLSRGLTHNIDWILDKLSMTFWEFVISLWKRPARGDQDRILLDNKYQAMQNAIFADNLPSLKEAIAQIENQENPLSPNTINALLSALKIA